VRNDVCGGCLVAMSSADHSRLSARCGSTVFHILGKGRIERAHISPGAILGSTGTLSYPARAH
jgi:hypothetical protein